MMKNWHVHLMNLYITVYLILSIYTSILFKWYDGIILFFGTLVLGALLSLPMNILFSGKTITLRIFESIKGAIILAGVYYLIFVGHFFS